jgi:FkbM family methyltransferase
MGLKMAQKKYDVERNVTVFDIGCRFGIHPSWKGLKHAEYMKYFAFDVDANEIKRLKKKYSDYSNYTPINCGFSNKEQDAEMNILAHHGQSSFFPPELKSVWFNSHRIDDAKIESKKTYKLTTLDKYCSQRNLYPDFLKIDTEGYDYRIIEGGRTILSSVLAIRCEVHFHQVFKGAEIFSDISSMLLSHGYQLANLDYDGRGIPNSYFCPNLNKYGIISGGEAVFIKSIHTIKELTIYQKIKLILFCFFNNLEDLALNLLFDVISEITIEMRGDAIWLEIKRQYCLAARQLLYAPGDLYNKAMQDYMTIFKEEFPDKHRFHESDSLNPA